MVTSDHGRRADDGVPPKLYDRMHASWYSVQHDQGGILARLRERVRLHPQVYSQSDGESVREVRG